MNQTIKTQLMVLIEQGKKCKETDYHKSNLSVPYFDGENLMLWKENCCRFLSENFPDEQVTKVILPWRGAKSIYESTYNQVVDGLQKLFERFNNE